MIPKLILNQTDEFKGEHAQLIPISEHRRDLQNSFGSFKMGFGMIYLDHNATTQMHPAVIKVMNELAGKPLNPSSIHSYGRKGKEIIETAREQVAKLLGIKEQSRDYQITFTASGTEANNLILTNFMDGEVFISAVEHLSISSYLKITPNIQVIKVDRNGVLDLADLTNKLRTSRSDKKLVSVMMANNETGVIQPLKQIAAIAHEFGALIHSDCIQAPGKIPVNLPELDLDFASISAHKFGGPIGSAALIAKVKYHLNPMILGGGQEKSRRSGTENVLSIAGFGFAAEIASAEQPKTYLKMLELRERLESSLLGNMPHLRFAGLNAERLPNTTLVINPEKKAETQIIALDLKGIAVSSGAACSSGRVGSSDVLKAMGYNEEETRSAIRISTGVNTGSEEIDEFVRIFTEINKK
jgi:cysteine desulfurase